MSDNPYATIRTQALREAIAAASFSDPEQRSRVDDLAHLERLLANGPGNWIGAISLGAMRSRHPVEAIRMEAELRRGVVLTVEEAERELTARRTGGDAAGRQERRMSEARATAEARRLNAWIAAGGRP